MAPRSVAQILGERSFGNPGAESLGSTSNGIPGQANAEVLGSETGAPPPTDLFSAQVIPESALAGSGVEPTLIVPAGRASRLITLSAPFVGFSIFVGNAGVRVSNGHALPAFLPYQIVLPGNQPLYAVTDAPTWLPLRVQIAPILIGDRERRV
jgi:hypothetical protein